MHHVVNVLLKLLDVAANVRLQNEIQKYISEFNVFHLILLKDKTFAVNYKYVQLKPLTAFLQNLTKDIIT